MSADALAATAHSHSLRSRLLWLLLAAVALVGTFQGVGTYRASLQQADAIFDEHLQQMAHAMRGGRPALLALAAVAASLIPASRAARVDVAQALRSE